MLYFIFVLWQLIFVHLPRFVIICTSRHVYEDVARVWDLTEKPIIPWTSILYSKEGRWGKGSYSVEYHYSPLPASHCGCSVNNHSYSHWHAFPTTRDYWIPSSQEPKVSIHFFKLFLFTILSKQLICMCTYEESQSSFYSALMQFSKVIMGTYILCLNVWNFQIVTHSKHEYYSC